MTSCFSNTFPEDVDYNPYSNSWATLRLQVSSAEDKISNRRALLSWYRSFDGDKVFTELSSDLREIKQIELELKTIPSERARQQARLESLRNAASGGFNPLYWFSSTRLIKKSEFQEQQKTVKQLTEKTAKLQQRLNAARERASKQKSELERYRGFDVLGEEAAEREMCRQLEELKSKLAQVQPLKEEFDQKLLVPRQILSGLTGRKKGLERDLRKAIDLESKLSAASNSYERKLIHEECGSLFGESKPSRAANDLRKKLEAINRDISKAKERFKIEVQRASLSTKVKMLVIDGSNLCYEGNSFIGLSALQVIALELSRKFRCLIVFDASIRKKLKMENQEIAAKFGDGVKVHVLASKQKADEMLLDAAASADAVVISNDRFGEFPDKPAIREERIIRHEILDNKVTIYALSFTGGFRRNS